MAWVVPLAVQYIGKDPIGDKWCVALARVHGMEATGVWIRGAKVKGKVLTPGTVIATFGADGLYKNKPGSSHAALYLGQNQHEIHVVEQYPGCGKILPQKYAFGDPRGGEKDGNNYYIVEHRCGPHRLYK